MLYAEYFTLCYYVGFLQLQLRMIVVHFVVRKNSHQVCNIRNTTDDNDGTNQSDSEMLLGKVQRDFLRRSKKLSGKRRNLLTSQNSTESDEVKTKMSSGKTSPSKCKPQVIPRTVTKPIAPIRKTVINHSIEAKKETSPLHSLSPNHVLNPDGEFWYVIRNYCMSK